jgi:2-iminoacetate synthase ThiH
MMFGHLETVADRIEHLERLRQQQDKSLARGNGASVFPRPATKARGEGQGEGLPQENDSSSPRPSPPDAPEEREKTDPSGDGQAGFTAFICWTFQAEHTKLRAPTVGAHEYLRTQALGRIYLDNFPSVQSSWVTQGQEIGQVALKFGANDLGSIMIEENVVSQAGTTFRMTVADMQRLIRELGYEPHQRDNWYRLLN